MHINRIALAQPNINCKQKAFGNNEVDKFRVIRAFDDARTTRPALIYSYKTEFMKKLSENGFSTSKNLIIGITGESTSGKTTIAKAIQKNALEKGLSLSLISCDNYHKDLSKHYQKYGSYAEALFAGENLESPRNFDLEKLNTDLEALKRGEAIKTPDFNFSTGVSTPHVHEVKPAQFVLLEGIVANHATASDINVYVECRDDIKLRRALARAEKRGQTQETMLKMWKFVKESAQLHIHPLRENADVIINGETNLKEIDVFIEKLIKAFKK